MRFDKSYGNWLPDGSNAVRYGMYAGRHGRTVILLVLSCGSLSVHQKVKKKKKKKSVAERVARALISIFFLYV